jgi:hypothetical protein
MATKDLAFVRGMADTRSALRRWNEHPGAVATRWLLGGFGYAVALLSAVTVIAYISTPDLTPAFIPGVAFSPDLGDMLRVMLRNGLVLALHAFACLAGFIAGSSLPLQAEGKTGASRWIHDRARPLAFAWVTGVTIFSLVTQAYILGSTGSQLANQFGLSPGVMVLTVLPHALVELTAVFLPLAAWTIASRRGDWQDLMAATFATVAMALPMLVIAAAWETWMWPQLIARASPLNILLPS